MNYKEFIQKYEELLNSGYCECNELNCLDNNPPKKILNIMKEQQQEIERLNNIIGEAIEYIEERYNGEVLTHTFDKDNVGELLNILKGVDKE